MKNLVAITTLLLLLSSCSKDDVSKIEIAYGFQALEVTFQTTGESTAPVALWRGETGMFTLKNPIDGLSIDSNTGILSWNSLLPVGENNITVVAQNQKSFTEVSLVIESTLAETYWLGWRNNDTQGNAPITSLLSRQIKFNRDGSVTAKLIDVEGSEGVGVWSRDGNSIEIHLCSYCPDLDPFSIPEYDEHSFYSGTLLNSGDEGATVSGQWYRIDFNPDSTSLRGQFGLLLSNENFNKL